MSNPRREGVPPHCCCTGPHGPCGPLPPRPADATMQADPPIPDPSTRSTGSPQVRRGSKCPSVAGGSCYALSQHRAAPAVAEPARLTGSCHSWLSVPRPGAACGGVRVVVVVLLVLCLAVVTRRARGRIYFRYVVIMVADMVLLFLQQPSPVVVVCCRRHACCSTLPPPPAVLLAAGGGTAARSN